MRRMTELHVPKARVARFVGLTRRALYPAPEERLPRRRPDEGRLCQVARRVALTHVTFGHRRVHAVLRLEGWEVNPQACLPGPPRGAAAQGGALPPAPGRGERGAGGLPI